MTKGTFNLLEKKQPEDTGGKSCDNEQIELLRVEARALREENNKVVSQLWEIDFKLTNPNAELSSEERTSLVELKKALSDKVESEKYFERITHLVEQIKQKEIELYGVSKISSTSPYEL